MSKSKPNICRMHFYTKFDVPLKNARHYDSNDNVDRICYMPNSALIQSFMSAGSQLRQNYAMNLAKDGLYDEEMIEKGTGVPISPFAVDPVDAERLNGALKEQMDTIVSEVVSDTQHSGSDETAPQASQSTSKAEHIDNNGAQAE